MSALSIDRKTHLYYTAIKLLLLILPILSIWIYNKDKWNRFARPKPVEKEGAIYIPIDLNIRDTMSYPRVIIIFPEKV